MELVKGQIYLAIKDGVDYWGDHFVKGTEYTYITSTNSGKHVFEPVHVGTKSMSFHQDVWEEYLQLKQPKSNKVMQKVQQSFILEAHAIACSEWKIKLEEKFPKAFEKTTNLNSIEESVNAIGRECYGYLVLFDAKHIYVPLPNNNVRWSLEAFEWAIKYCKANKNTYPEHNLNLKYPGPGIPKQTIVITHNIPADTDYNITTELFEVDESFIKLAHRAANNDWKAKLEAAFPEVFKPLYPKLMISNGGGNDNSCNKGMVLFMTSDSNGQVVFSPEGCSYRVGHTSNDWNIKYLEDYKPC